jgi:hypothetical protein
MVGEGGIPKHCSSWVEKGDEAFLAETKGLSAPTLCSKRVKNLFSLTYVEAIMAAS